MKKLIITLLSVLFISLAFSQDYTSAKSASKPLTYTTLEQAIGRGAPIGNYSDSLVAKTPLYEGSRGGHYYITKLKDGTFKRNYKKDLVIKK